MEVLSPRTSVDSAGQPLGTNVSKPLAGRLILLVEDLPEPTRAAAQSLRAAGAEVVLEYHALAAVELVRRGGPPLDAVVLDLQLSVFDTLEAVRGMRQAGFDRQIVGVISADQVLTGHILQRAGCTFVLPRPLDAARLVTALISTTITIPGRGPGTPE